MTDEFFEEDWPEDKPAKEPVTETATETDTETPAPAPAVDAMAQEEFQEKLAEAEKKVLYALAEARNVRERARNESDRARKYALEAICEDLLSVVDSLEKSLEVEIAEGDTSAKTLQEGSEMTLSMFLKVLEKYGIKQLSPEGEPFDPKVHEALTMQPNPEVEPNTVLTVVQKGYLLHDRVVRPARVVVSKN